ncbi:MAG: tRNA-modifying protein YgfZ [Arsenophonus sp.]
MNNKLPLKLIILNDWSFITATGVDAKKYLQGQLTADIFELSSHQHVFTAHCDATGKMWSTLRLFHYKDGFAYILRTSMAEKQLNELKKYAIFSQITLKIVNNVVLLGVSGKSSCDVLKKYFCKLPDKEKSVIHLGQSTLLYLSLPSERFLIITDNTTSTELKKYFIHHIDSQEWLALDIASGFANIDIENSLRFIPQSVNLQSLSGSISFQKGCYIGQEIIARAKYRGVNKNTIFWLIGSGNSIPKIGEPIEWKNGDNWRSTGTILSAVKLTDKTISLQVVMRNDMIKKSLFRLSGEDESKLTIKSFPNLLVNK